MVTIPFRTEAELESAAESFLQKYHSSGTIPVPIEPIVEFQLGLEIVPIKGLQYSHEVEAFLTRDLSQICVDDGTMETRLSRYRFSLAHEVGHVVLHGNIWRQFPFHDIASWKAFVEDFPERQYRTLEFQANHFAAAVLVPRRELPKRLEECIELARQHGLDERTIESGIDDYIASKIARQFEVSAEVIRIRLAKLKLR